MKKIILSLSVLFQLYAGAQNVGIGTTTPARAKLEVHGGVGISAAIFGGGNRGVSLYRTRPGIEFNQYKEPFYPIGKFMSNGPAAELYFDIVSGNMVIEILSRIISDTLDGRIADIHTLNYSGFGVLAIKAIQEQQQTIEAQQIALDKQQAEINELKKAVSGLQKQQSHMK